MGVRARVGIVCVVLVATVLIGVLSLPSADAANWTQTSESDFLAGTVSNADVLASGDVRLRQTNGTWARAGLVLNLGSPGAFDDSGVRVPYVIKDGSTYKMWYVGYDGSRHRLGYATSSDGATWTKQGVVLDVLQPPWNFDGIHAATIRKEGATYKVWITGGHWAGGPEGNTGRIYYGESADGVNWNIMNIALDLGPLGTWDDSYVSYPVVDVGPDGKYYLFYDGWDGTAGGWNFRLGLATSTGGTTFSRVGIDPVLTLGPTGAWDARNLQSHFVLPGSPWRMWYSASDGTDVQIGFADSPDGFNWTRAGDPVFTAGAPGQFDDAGVWAPDLLQDGTDTWMYYTGNDGSYQRIGRARLAPGFAAGGTFASQVLDTGTTGSVWSTLSTTATVPGATQLLLSTRSGNTPTPDASWSPWTPGAAPGSVPIASPRARYLQVRATFSTSDSTVSPLLQAFTVTYEPNRAGAPTPLSPTGGAWVTSPSIRATWAYGDPEGDPQQGFRVEVSVDPSFVTVDPDSGVVLSANEYWDSPPLADGTWYWRVRTLDVHGTWSAPSGVESFRIDTASPTTTVTFLTGSIEYIDGRLRIESTDLISLSASDPSPGSGPGLSEYRIQGGPALAYVSPFPPGVHGVATLEFRTTDVAGNVEPWNRVEFLVDDRPSAAPASPSDGAWVTTAAVRVAWAYSDPDGDPQAGFRVDLAPDPSFGSIAATSGDVVSSAHEYTFLGVPDGTYYWRVAVADTLGAWGVPSGSQSLSVDTTAPVTTATLITDSGIFVNGYLVIDPTDIVELTATDPSPGSGVSSIEFIVNVGPPQTYVGPFPINVHGYVTLFYRSSDAAGNVAPWTALSFIVDREPSANPSMPPDGAWVTASSVTLSWGYSDPEGDPQTAYLVELTTDPTWATVTFTSGVRYGAEGEYTFLGIPDGMYRWRVQVRDSLGLWSLGGVPRDVSVDTSLPSVAHSIDSVLGTVEGRAWIPPDALVTLTATDSGSGVAAVYVDLDGTVAVYAGPFPVSGHGIHTLSYWAVDAAGNTGPVTTFEVLLDGPPSASNAAPGNGGWVTTPGPLLDWTYSDPDGDAGDAFEVEVSTDPVFTDQAARSGLVEAAASAWAAPSLGDGDYHWRVRVRDSFGVWSAWSSPTQVRIDATLPESRVLVGGSEVQGSVRVLVDELLVIEASDAGSGVARIEYSVNGGPWTTYAAPISFPTDGVRTLAFRAVDAAGNVGPVELVSVDVVYPTNWTPLVAAILAIVLGLAGLGVASRRGDPTKSKAGVWALVAGPATLLEGLVGVYSFLTGEFAMPPWTGAGLFAIVLIGVMGGVGAAVGWLSLPRRKG